MLLMLATAGPITFKSSQIFEESSKKSEAQSNADQANARATEVENLILGYIDKSKTVHDILAHDFATDDERKHALDLIFYNDRDMVNFEIYQMKNGQAELYRRETNESYLQQYKLDRTYIERLRLEKKFPLAQVFQNNIEVRNSSQANGAPLLSIGVPFKDDTGLVTHIALVDIRLDRILKAFASLSARTLYLVDADGSVLAHPNDKLALEGASFTHLPIVQDALASKVRRGQKRFLDPVENSWFEGAYSKTSFNIIVIAQAPEDVILEPARIVRREAITLAGYILSVALFFVFLFSGTITSPIEALHDVTVQVAHGNFDVKARGHTRNEVGELGRSFNTMVDGLKERDKAKSILNKFHGSSVTDDLMKSDLNLGGSRKEVTVFFSDIRDFTKFSEGHTPEEVVEMLNEYFQIMVGIVTKHHGIVDKFVGDAMMAVWGAPQSTGKDPYYAVKACLEMRAELAKLNEIRAARGQVPIKVGMGLHSGPAISGTIGSTERMEYTVIGDTVNMASRIESSTKAFGVDLLISEGTAKDITDRFILDYAGAAEVKGKSEPIKMHKVIGFIDDNGQQVIVRTPFSEYAAQDADKVKIAS